MSTIYTLLGVPYVAVLDPVRGVVLQKAARKRIPSPGQMSLFAGNDPKEGDTKVENGVTYRLNQHSRWERTDKAKKANKAKPKVVVPVVEEKVESKAKAKSKPPGIADMRQKGDTGSRRDEVKPMPNFEDEPTPVAAEVVVDEPKPKQRLGDRMRAIAQELRQETEAQKQYTARMLGAAAQLAQNQDNLIDEVVDMVNEDLDTPEALPEPTIGDMLAEQKAEEEAGGMEVQGIAVEQGSNGLTTNPETFRDDWARLKELELDGIAKRVGTGLTYKIPGYTFINKEIYKTDPNTYRQTAVNWFAVMPDKSSAQETQKASAETQESLPKETRGGDGRKMISTADAASALAEAVNGRLWQKKEGEIRIYVSGTNNGYLRISPETDSTSQVQYFMKSYDIPKVEEAVNAFNREYQITDMEDKRPKEKILMQENEDGVIAPAGQHEPDTYITREWYE